MAALDFPNSPTLNQVYPATPIAGVPNYIWDGTKWSTTGAPAGSFYVAKSGDTNTLEMTMQGGMLSMAGGKMVVQTVVDADQTKEKQS